MAASQLLLSLYLVATLAVFAAASGYPSTSQQLPSSSNDGPNLDKVAVGSGSSCDDTKELLAARDECCNNLGKDGHCVCSAAKQVFDCVEFLQLCKDYDACSSGSWNDVETGGDDAATSSSKPAAGGCSFDKDNLVSTAKQCKEMVKILKDLALAKKSSGDSCFKEALAKLGVKNNLGVVEKLLLPAGY